MNLSNRARIATTVLLTIASLVAGLTSQARARLKPHPVPTTRQLDCGTWGCFPTFPTPGPGWEEMLVQSNVTSTLCLDAGTITGNALLQAKQCNGQASQDWWVRPYGTGGDLQLAIWSPTAQVFYKAGWTAGLFLLQSGQAALYRWSDVGSIKILMDSGEHDWLNTPPVAGLVLPNPLSEDNGWIFTSLCFNDADCTT